MSPPCRTAGPLREDQRGWIWPVPLHGNVPRDAQPQVEQTLRSVSTSEPDIGPDILAGWPSGLSGKNR